MSADPSSLAGLWLAVVFVGLYHGLNPGMGWPLAVSAGLMGNGRRDLLRSLVPLAAGHLLAMLSVLLPFAFLLGLVEWQWEIQVGASLLLIAIGLYLYFNRRHPRMLARISPNRLALWSFAIATAHGAGLMLVPIYLGICQIAETDVGHVAAASLMATSIWAALGVGLVHACAMIAGGGAMALLVHEWLGLKFLSRSWFNLSAVWAISLVLVGMVGLYMAGTAGESV